MSHEFSTNIDHTPIHFDTALVDKYDRPGPRYTSYPTAPQWQAAIDSAGYQHILSASNALARPLSLYVHLPFCESHCTFCGCNVVITKQHAVTAPYLADLARELGARGLEARNEHEDRRHRVMELPASAKHRRACAGEKEAVESRQDSETKEPRQNEVESSDGPSNTGEVVHGAKPSTGFRPDDRGFAS